MKTLRALILALGLVLLLGLTASASVSLESWPNYSEYPFFGSNSVGVAVPIGTHWEVTGSFLAYHGGGWGSMWQIAAAGGGRYYLGSNREGVYFDAFIGKECYTAPLWVWPCNFFGVGAGYKLPLGGKLYLMAHLGGVGDYHAGDDFYFQTQGTLGLGWNL